MRKAQDDPRSVRGSSVTILTPGWFLLGCHMHNFTTPYEIEHAGGDVVN